MKRVSATLVCISFAALLYGQGERSTLNGTITDPNGGAVPDATVLVTNLETNVEFGATTTGAGVYRLPYLPAGTYRIAAKAAGFRTSLAENVQLAVAQTLTVDLKLEIGQVTEQVTVSAEPPLIETGSSELGRYVAKREFDTWPIQVWDGRRQLQSFIFRALPGAVGSEYQGSINGGQGFSHEILIEGISIGRWDIAGGSNNEFSPSAEAVSEFKLQTGTINAQYGGGQTAVANFAVKSGTNALHGSAYDYMQNDAFRANSSISNALNLKRPPYKLQNFGGGIGGPVYLPKAYNGRNRTFWYTNYERSRIRDFYSTGSRTVPTLDMKKGDFSRLFDPSYTGNQASGTVVGKDGLGNSVRFGQIYDPRTTRVVNGATVRDPFAGNIIPQSAWSKVASNIVNKVGFDDPMTGTLFSNMPVYANCCQVFDEHMFSVKVDHNVNQSQRASAFFNLNHRQRTSTSSAWGQPPGLPTNVYADQYTPGRMVRLAYDWTVSPTVINHLAAGYNRFGNIIRSTSANQDWAGKIGLQNTAPTTFPVLTFSGLAVLGGSLGSYGNGSYSQNYNGSTIVQDDVTIVRGKHNVKLGTEVRFYYLNQRNVDSTGNLTFTPTQTQLPGFATSTGNAFASFLLGAVNSTSRAINRVSPGIRGRQIALYVADDWKITPKLTINAGLRWEIIPARYEVGGRWANMDPAKPNPGAGNIPGALVWAEDLGKKGFQRTNWRQLSPRFGFAYAFSPKFVMRGGYGITNRAAILDNYIPSLAGYNGSLDLSPVNVPLQFSQDPVIWLDQPYPSFTGTLPAKNPAFLNGQGVTYVNPDSTTLGYVQNYNLGFQYQLPQDFVVEADYIGNKGTRLPGSGLDAMNRYPLSAMQFGDKGLQALSANPGLAPLPYPGFTGTLHQALRPFPQYNNVSQYAPNFGLSNYNALQVMVKRRLTKGLSVLVAYAFSKALNNVKGSGEGTVTPQDIANRRLEWAVTDYNRPQNLKTSWIFELPFGKGRRYHLGAGGNAILGGWNLTGMHNYRSGSPIGVTMSGYRWDGTIRPDAVPGVPVVLNTGTLNTANTATSIQYLNPAAFKAVPLSPNGVPTRIGTAPRNLSNVRGPAFYSEDFGIQKRLAFGETRAVELRGDAINAFNRAGLANPVTDVTSPLFGKITGVQQNSRSIQLSLRLSF